MILEIVFGLLGAFALGAVRSGLAVAGAIGFLLIGAWAYFGVPVGLAGLVLFATAAVLFWLAGGVR